MMITLRQEGNVDLEQLGFMVDIALLTEGGQSEGGPSTSAPTINIALLRRARSFVRGVYKHCPPDGGRYPPAEGVRQLPLM